MYVAMDVRGGSVPHRASIGFLFSFILGQLQICQNEPGDALELVGDSEKEIRVQQFRSSDTR